MRRLAAISGILAFAAVLGGCGADVKEEAPAAATGEVLAQAPPNAVGAGVDRPVAEPPSTPPKIVKDPSPGVTGHPGKPPPLMEEPADPTPPPNGDGKPQKGTDL
jgi:hypothetical protein